MSAIAEVEYYNDGNGTIKKITFGDRENDVFYIQPFQKVASFKCSKVTIVDGETIISKEDWPLNITTYMQVPVVDGDLNPVMIPNPNYREIPNPGYDPETPGSPETIPDPETPAEVQKTINEWDFWIETFWKAIPQQSMKTLLEAQIAAKLGLISVPLYYIEA